MLRQLVKRFGRSAGIEISQYRPFASRRARRIEQAQITTVLDVGANMGQYGRELRNFRYDALIISFEPLKAAFAELSAHARKDGRWQVHQLALGDVDGDTLINVASNTSSSSLLEMLPKHHAGAPLVQMIGTERVRTSQLDSMQLPLRGAALLKLDVQGYEDRVLAGASKILAAIGLVECELSLAELYKGQPSFRHTVDLLGDHGFEIVDLDPFFYDKTDGRVLAVDALFERR